MPSFILAMKKRVPYDIASYEEITDGGCCYVDKTAYIRELEAYKCPVFLRPRRFGKSLWCPTLACYYDINRTGPFDEFFGKTAIGRDPTPLHSTMLVLSFDFSLIRVGSSLQDIGDDFSSVARESIRSFCR